MSSLVDQAEELLNAHKLEEAKKVLEQALAAEPNNIEVLWRFSRLHFELGASLGWSVTVNADAAQEDGGQKAHYEKAYEYGLKAVEADKDNGLGYKWAGLALGLLSNFKTLKDKILDSFKIKELLESAESKLPEDPTVKHALGKWCFTIASIGWVQRTAVSAFVASPPESTYEEAMKFFQATESILSGQESNPKFASVISSNLLFIGKTSEAQSQKDNAKVYYQKVVDFGVKGGNAVQQANVDDANARLKALSSSWW
eukprot:TRINITY_DN8664_c0_g1_i1.p2 TRINITY_DN8664_c0_g1~~TRINITY_DN8664_c0_g1_i1.p2  ORF type:complete len:257 (-),score=71.98 TRINITY_DN8664_c0_g1_i1:45-815(-)